MSDEDTKEKEPIRRISQVELRALLTDHVIPMLKKNMTFGEVCEELRVITGKSSSQCQRYVSRAIEELSKDFNRDVAQQRMEMVTGLRSDVSEAYTNYMMADTDRDRAMWFKIYQDVKKRVADLSPNELKAEAERAEVKPTEIVFNFNKVTKEDIDPEDL